MKRVSLRARSLHLLLLLTFLAGFASTRAHAAGEEDASATPAADESSSPTADESSSPRRHRVMLATPCYGGHITDAFHLSVIRAYEHYAASDAVSLVSATVPGIADLPKARGALVAQFLRDPSLTHLLFVDADVAFAPELIQRFAESGHDVVAGMYPKKGIDWGRLASRLSKPRGGAADANADAVDETTLLRAASHE
jgi:hypothetical protein